MRSEAIEREKEGDRTKQKQPTTTTTPKNLCVPELGQLAVIL